MVLETATSVPALARSTVQRGRGRGYEPEPRGILARSACSAVGECEAAGGCATGPSIVSLEMSAALGNEHIWGALRKRGTRSTIVREKEIEHSAAQRGGFVSVTDNRRAMGARHPWERLSGVDRGDYS
jgi:hypothetical protein